MTVEKFKSLLPITTFDNHRDYEKVRKRLAKGVMTTYIYKGSLYYDPEEYVDKLKNGRKSKLVHYERKPIVKLDVWVQTNKELLQLLRVIK